MNHLFCFGYSYTATFLIGQLSNNFKISATSRHQLKVNHVELFDYESLLMIPSSVTHLLISIPPSAQGDIVIERYRKQLDKLPNLRWICYLSSTGVYGDHDGLWVNETSELRSHTASGQQRIRAENEWLDLGSQLAVPTFIFRLAGIYGPGRSVFDRIQNNTAQIIIKPGQFFSRIHVHDIASALKLAIAHPELAGIYNLADDMPTSPEEPTLFAYQLLNLQPPSPIALDDSAVSPMLRQFYLENKRVSNIKLKETLGLALKYHNYKIGLKALLSHTSS